MDTHIYTVGHLDPNTASSDPSFIPNAEQLLCNIANANNNNNNTSTNDGQSDPMLTALASTGNTGMLQPTSVSSSIDAMKRKPLHLDSTAGTAISASHVRRQRQKASKKGHSKWTQTERSLRKSKATEDKASNDIHFKSTADNKRVVPAHKNTGNKRRVPVHTVQIFNSLWNEYIQTIINIPAMITSAVSLNSTIDTQSSAIHELIYSGCSYSCKDEQSMTSLLKAEYVGARMRVVKSKNPCLVDLEGIVMGESEAAFDLALHTKGGLQEGREHGRHKQQVQDPRQQDQHPLHPVQQKMCRVVRIPKANCVFEVDLSTAGLLNGSSLNKTFTSLVSKDSSSSPLNLNIKVCLFGNQLLLASADRITKKFKSKPNILLN